MRKPSRWIYIFGFLPGLGQMMLGLMNRGLQFMFIFWGLIFLASNSIESFMVFLPLLVFYAYYDALQRYREILETGTASDTKLFQWSLFHEKKKWVGWGLIIFGGFSFIQLIIESLPSSIRDYIPYNFIEQFVIIIALIGLGYKLLRGEKENQVPNSSNHITPSADITTSNSSESGEK
ncbi:MAG: putative rane protein [Bacillales bacterium]|jgi:TM2 domain-containing membrane protein YozV|nr:putative rane protein [Bacillales bacterium]